jgi:hypothetical protein
MGFMSGRTLDAEITRAFIHAAGKLAASDPDWLSQDALKISHQLGGGIRDQILSLIPPKQADLWLGEPTKNGS